MTPTRSLDIAEVARRTDLAAVLSDRLGPPHPGRPPRWKCPFHADSEPSLYVYGQGRKWRCWPCNATGDALDFLARLDNVSVASAARKLAGVDDGRPARKRRPRPVEPPAPAPAVEPSAPWQSPEWQAAASSLIDSAAATLWGPEGRPALDWLRGRGLADDVISRFRLGFLPEGARSEPLECLAGDDGRPRPIAAPQGVTIPWAAPGGVYGPGGGPWVGCNVRRLRDDPREPWTGPDKCLAFRGSSRGYAYPWGELCPGVPALLCEGEFDALIGWQHLGHVVEVLTVGGASQTPRPEALQALAGCPDWLLGFDHDGPGDQAARRWTDLAPRKARRVVLPFGKDLGEFVQMGGDPLDWLRSEFDRLGWRWPLGTPPEGQPR